MQRNYRKLFIYESLNDKCPLLTAWDLKWKREILVENSVIYYEPAMQKVSGDIVLISYAKSNFFAALCNIFAIFRPFCDIIADM